MIMDVFNDTEQWFIYVTDEDSHRYIIPKEKESEWYKFFEDEDYPYKELPNWAVVINGPWKFKNYEL